MSRAEALIRAAAFSERYNLQAPIIMAPMAGASPVELAVAVANGGGMGACGALLMDTSAIDTWVSDMRAASNGSFQLNTWIPDPPPARDHQREAAVRTFLEQWGPPVAENAAEQSVADFGEQCEAMLRARPTVVSSIMGLYPNEYVKQLKAAGIDWFANVTTVQEALAAADAGADVIVAQGMEAGGHRGTFDAHHAEQSLVGLFALLPAIADAVDIPVVATGGIADARGASAALLLGASAVQMGTGFLRSPEAGIAPAWSQALGNTAPEQTVPTRAFSGRLGRSIKTAYVTGAASDDAPVPAPYPIQRHLTQAMRSSALAHGNLDAMQVWAGQSAAMAKAQPAAEIVDDLWRGMKALLG